MDIAELKLQFNDFVNAANIYFSQLNDYEKYAWIAEAVGFCVIIAGIVMLF